jgi:hydroxymethylglutaryl-CoA reductase (NADPH)
MPSLKVRQLYTFGSLRNAADGFRFGIKNRLRDAVVTRLAGLHVDGREIPQSQLWLEFAGGATLPAVAVTPERPLAFALRTAAQIHAVGAPLGAGRHAIQFWLETSPFGTVAVEAEDALAPVRTERPGIPYDKDDARNYSREMAEARRRFVAAATGASLDHVGAYSFDPEATRGNIENFAGAAQVPLGFAGPLRLNGEHARGDFLIPLATTEGSLVASYNRGMKVLSLAGGVTCTVSGDCMQRAPVFVFDSAREARGFRDWVDRHMEEIRREAEATSRVARLLFIETYLSNKFAYLRFNYATGDAAGQNMVGRATFAACDWLRANAPGIRTFYLESNFATDKKASYVNMLRTRGKRVTAEAVIPRALLRDHLRVEPEVLQAHAGVANVGALLSGTNNNGLHSANAITALFIATGQDVANVAEGSAALVYSELTTGGDFHLSITLPSLIVATHGGGTGLATQRECLETLGCWGPGKVNKLAEIVAGVVLAGELSLAAAISAFEWVPAHERYGRKR